MPDNTHAGVHSSRPAILIGGQEDAVLAEGLQRMEIVETTQGLYRCEAAFTNWGPKNQGVDFLYFDRAKLDFGKSFTVKYGDGNLFDGRILGLEASFPEAGGAEITVLAEDRFQDLRMTRRTRTFNNVSDADVTRQLANDHGLAANVHVDGPTYSVLIQVNQSDMAFLRERARSIDAELWMEGSTLKIATRANRRGNAIEMTLGHELRSFTALADLAHQRTTVSAQGWDVSGKTAISYDADDSVIQGELNGDASGTSILRTALGNRKESVAHGVPLTNREAQAMAESHFKACARRFVVGRGIAETQSDLRVGAVLDLKNLGPLFEGKYYVVESRHRFDSQRGLRTEFVAERPGIGQP